MKKYEIILKKDALAPILECGGSLCLATIPNGATIMPPRQLDNGDIVVSYWLSDDDTGTVKNK